MLLSRIFTKQSIFIIFIICLFIFILNNNIIETKLKQKYNNSNNNLYNNNNNNYNNNNKNKVNNKIKLQYSKLNNLNFLNQEFPQLYTYNTERDEKIIEFDNDDYVDYDNNNDNDKLFNNEIKEEWSKLPTDMMIEKKRICIVTTEIEGPVLGGGIGTAYTALSQKLNEDGHTITIVLVNKVKKLSASHWIELYKQAGIELIVLDFLLVDPLTTVGGAKVAIENQNAIDPNDMDNVIGIVGCTGPCIRSYRTYLWLSRHESQFDVIHFHDNGGMAYFISLAQHQGLHFQSINIVVGGHGPHLWERTANSANLDDGKHFEVDYLEKKSVEYSNWLISPSNYMLNWMKYNRWQLPIHSYVHQNLLPGKNLEPQPDFDNVLFKQQQSDDSSITTATTRGKKHDFNELLFFGRLESRKGLDTFLIALESLSDLIKNKKMQITFLGSNTKLVELNMMADFYIEIVCKRLDIPCQVLIGKSHTEAIQYLTTDKENKLVIVASPIDNSPNTVLECLTHRLAIIATNVGGIPELIHPEDRDRVLFDPKPKSLVKLIKKLKADGVSPAHFSTDEWTRQIIWSNWHSVVQISPLIQSKNKKINQLKLMNQKKLLTIVLIYDRENMETLIKNIKSIGSQSKTTPFYVVEIIIAKSNRIPGGSNGRVSLEVTKLLNEYSLTYNITVINQYLLQPFQVWNSKEIIHQSKGDFVLFLDPLDYLSNNALELLGQVESFTDSSIITGSVLFSNNSMVINQIYQQLNSQQTTTNDIDTTTSISSIFLGCSGMPGMMYNCYGSNNMMVRKSTLLDFGNQYSFEEISDYNSDIENSGAWDFYAQATNNGYTLETIPKNIFISDRVEYEPPNSYNQELRVLKNFDNILPTSFELAPLATRHFLTSKKYYVNEIINANAKSKECDRLLSIGGGQQPQQQEIFNDDGEENKQYMETRNHIKMVFIRGHEKSGTSWLKKVVDLHPRIFMAKQEFHFAMLEEGLDKFTSTPWAAAQEPYRSYTKKWYKSFVRNLLLSGVSPSLAPLINWVGEKTPSPLAPIISGSNYILIVRDGRDVVVSLFWHYVRLGGFENWCGPNEKHLVNPDYVKEYRATNSSKDYFDRYPERLLENEVCFRKIVGGWVKRVQDDQAAIDTLESNPVAKVFSLRYEELHRNPEENRRAIYEFLNLDYNEAEALSVDDKTLPGGFNEKSDKNKFFRKGEIGDWVNYFTSENKIWFKEETGSLLVDLGYELNNDW